MKSKKQLIIFLVVVFLTWQTKVFAHSALVSSNPKAGATVKGALSEIILTFNTEIEKGSRLTLLHNGQTTKPHVTVQGNQLVATFSSPLTEGRYTVRWEIIGADGHQVSGEYSFTVQPETSAEKNENEREKEGKNGGGHPLDEPQSNQTDQNDTADENTPEERTRTDEPSAQDQSEAAAQNNVQKHEDADVLPWVAGALIVIAFASFGWLVKKGRT